MAKLTDYGAITRFDSNGILITDGSSGTKKIAAKDAALDLAGMVSAVQHRNTFGGRNLGTLTNELKARIHAALENGSFDNLFIGDYVLINGKKHFFADFDYFYNTGDSAALTAHHAVLVPEVLYNATMNETNTSEGGYLNTQMHTEHLNSARSTISDAWGSMLTTTRQALVNAVTDGCPSGYAWVDCTVELMNEVMLYGCYHYAAMNKGSTQVVKYTTMNQQLSLFRLSPAMKNQRVWYWLQDVASPTGFSDVPNSGIVAYAGASNSHGVRPWYVIH